MFLNNEKYFLSVAIITMMMMMITIYKIKSVSIQRHNGGQTPGPKPSTLHQQPVGYDDYDDDNKNKTHSLLAWLGEQL